MLFLVGIGLSEKDVSLKALETCRACDVVYLERYTSFISDARINFLEEAIGIHVKLIGRKELEDDAKAIAEESISKDVAVVVGGDPLIATTHKTMFLEAIKRGVHPSIVHSASAVSAAMGESGLDFYKFGRVCTIPRWSQHYEPVSFYETIARNAASGQHSLLLLDFDQERQSSIPIEEAIRILRAAEARYGKGTISEESPLLVLHKLSFDGQRVVYTTIGKASSLALGNGPTILVLPAPLSDIEREILESMHGV